MKLNASHQAVEFEAKDINGNTVRLSDYLGRPVILSFFRDASCPFCNMRVYEYTQKFQAWSDLGIEVIAIFSSETERVRKFVHKNPRPFITIGDPDLILYHKYGIEESLKGLLRALMLRMPRIAIGWIRGGRPDLKNPNGKIMPADFIISPSGRIIKAWYGKDASDHIPMRLLDRFSSKVRKVRIQQEKKQNSKKKLDLFQLQLAHQKAVINQAEDAKNIVNISNNTEQLQQH